MNMMILYNGKKEKDILSFKKKTNYFSFYLLRFSPYVIPLMNTLQLCSIYYTVAVSLDRFLYLSYGIQAELICTVRNSLRVIAIITIFSILFILPHWFKHQVKLNKNNRVQLECKKKKKYGKIFLLNICFSNINW
jgi:hypothetical protein